MRAEFDYVAQQEEELSFEEGAIMDLLEQDDPDWYLVRLNNGEIGLAPSNYVQDVEGGASAQQHEHYEEQEEQEEYQTPQASIPPPPVAPILTEPQAAPPQPVLSQAVSSHLFLGLKYSESHPLHNDFLDRRNSQGGNCR